MREIPINRLLEELTYDAATGNLSWRHPEKNPDRKRGPIGYLVNGYVRVSFDGQCLLAHRVAWAMHYGEWPKERIDHHDRDRANNRISNLRLATESQNQVNAKTRGALPCKGVSWECKRAKYRAQIKMHRVARHLGYYNTMDEAAHAYNKAAVNLHGEFAILNPIGTDK